MNIKDILSCHFGSFGKTYKCPKCNTNPMGKASNNGFCKSCVDDALWESYEAERLKAAELKEAKLAAEKAALEEKKRIEREDQLNLIEEGCSRALKNENLTVNKTCFAQLKAMTKEERLKIFFLFCTECGSSVDEDTCDCENDCC